MRKFLTLLRSVYVLQWLDEQKLIQKLVALIDPQESEAVSEQLAATFAFWANAKLNTFLKLLLFATLLTESYP